MNHDSTNSHSEVVTVTDWRDADRLRKMYWDDGMSSTEIADELGCSKPTILDWMDRHGIETRSVSEAAVNRGLHTPVRLFTRTNGYEQFREKHRGDELRVFHHRLLAVVDHGFDALSGSVVHHKNNIRWDNRPSNIELVGSQSDHMKLHADEISGRSRSLSWLDEIRLREMYRNGDCTQETIADQFDVSLSTTQSVIAGTGHSRFAGVPGGVPT